MTPNNEKPNFLDRGTLTAFALILLFWFGWSKFMESMYPAQPQSQTQAGGAAPTPAPNAGSLRAPVKTGEVVAAAMVAAPIEEKFVSFDDENMSFRLSSKGMGLSDINVKKFKTRENKPIVLGQTKGDYPFATVLVENGGPVDFAIEQTAADTFVGHASVAGLSIEKTVKVTSSKYAIDTNVKVTGSLEGFKGLGTKLIDVAAPEEEGSFLTRGNEHQEWYVRYDDTKNRSIISLSKGTTVAAANVSIAALSSHYFTLAVSDHSDVAPSFSSNVTPGATAILGQLSYVPLAKNDVFNVKYTAFAGPKSFEILSSVDENLNQVVDYGMFGALGKPILWLLKFLQSMIGNWGWAIVALTIIVRALVLPFNAYAFKSMKAMQRIQPEMNRIKERYKDKPAEEKLQMNQEIMQLMKTNNASPVGGCLPTLLQLPVFFALYQVLGQSIELYRAPFVLWIHDLSAKDPYFVLPVLMGITMFLQQKITPTAMDPQQAKILQWMPVIFSVFMLTLPSGLTLYIFVSTLFGILQQYYFMRDKSKTAPGRVKEAKA